jgi:ectoine hydroxylase-related dioxygenase (phytanoyl-CoA dioxygenase family)
MTLRIEDLRQDLAVRGYALIPGVIGKSLLERLRHGIRRAHDGVVAEIGKQRLDAAGELGVVRLPMRFDSVFFDLLEYPELVAIVDATVGAAGILHLQNAFVLPSTAVRSERVFQETFHRDFPRDLNGYVASINIMVAVDDFRADNGATIVVPGSHGSEHRLSPEWMRENGVPIVCPAGSFVVFDSTLWHAAGSNTSGHDRMAINHQFTRSWIKQQIDYVRALGENLCSDLPERTRQMLGWHTRVVTSLDEYYQPDDKRLYRRGQG